MDYWAGCAIRFFGFPFGQPIPVFARDVFRVVGDTDATVAAPQRPDGRAQGVGALFAALSLALFSSIRWKGLALSLGQVVSQPG